MGGGAARQDNSLLGTALPSKCKQRWVVARHGAARRYATLGGGAALLGTARIGATLPSKCKQTKMLIYKYLPLHI